MRDDIESSLLEHLLPWLMIGIPIAIKLLFF